MSARPCLDTAALAAYLEGEVTLSERAAIEADLRDSASARRTLEGLRNVRDLLAAPATDLENIDLASRVRGAVRQAPPDRGFGARRFSMLWLGGLAACLACALLFIHRPLPTPDFRAKSNGVRSVEGKRWAGIQVYRVAGHGTPEPLGAGMAPSDGLLFSYTNLGALPFHYLMIFGIDAEAQVRWYYPAYESVGTEPTSIAIEPARANAPLGELLQQDLAFGPLSLYALFTNRPLKVLEVEAWLKEHQGATSESPVPGGVLQRIDTQVLR